MKRLAIALIGMLPCAVAPATAQVSFRGKTITLVVGFGAGDGFDTYARFLARHLPRHIPGEPAIVVQNMPGAGSITALNFVINKGAKDGTTLGIVNPVATIQNLLQPSIAPFDSRELAWIGSMASDYYTCGFWTTKNVSLADYRGRKVVIGSTALSGGTYAGNMVMSHVLGLDVQNVAGYRTMGELVIAAEKGEVEGHCGVMAATLKSTFWPAYQAGRLRVVVAAALKPEPDLAEIPNAFDLVSSDEQRQLLMLLAGPWRYGRPIFAPPASQPEAVAPLRAGFEAMMGDGEFLREARSLRMPIEKLSGQEVTAILQQIYAIPKATLDRAKPMFGVAD